MARTALYFPLLTLLLLLSAVARATPAPEPVPDIEEALKLRPWRLTSNSPPAAARAAVVKAELPSGSPSSHASRGSLPPSVNGTHHQFIRRAAIVNEVDAAASSAENPAAGNASRRRTLPISSASATVPSVQPSTSIFTVPTSPSAEGLATAAVASDSQAQAAEAPSSVVTTGLVTANTDTQRAAKVANTDITSTVVVIATPTPTEVVVSLTSTASQQEEATASLQTLSNGAGEAYGGLKEWKVASGVMVGAALLLA